MRCGKCNNCLKLEKAKKSVLACCGTPCRNGNSFNHADDGVVAVWNDAVKDYPCITQLHFDNWLKHSVDERDHAKVIEGIEKLLKEYPNLLETHSWLEMRNLAERSL